MRGVAAGGLVLLTAAALAGGLIAVGNPATFVSDKVEEFKDLDVAAPGETRFGSTGGQRYDLWRIALNDFRDHPVAGVGEGSYPTNYYAERRTDRNLSTPHSLAFATLAELGIVGLLLLLVVPAPRSPRWLRAGAPPVSASGAGVSAMVAGGTVLLGQSTSRLAVADPGPDGARPPLHRHRCGLREPARRRWSAVARPRRPWRSRPWSCRCSPPCS